MALILRQIIRKPKFGAVCVVLKIFYVEDYFVTAHSQNIIHIVWNMWNIKRNVAFVANKHILAFIKT